MKFKLISAYLVIFLLALSVQSGRKVNSRKVPTANDFLSEGAGPRYANQESLNVELANILTSTKDRNAIDVDMVIGDSISTVTSVVSGAGGVDIDTVINVDQIVSGAGGTDFDTLKGVDQIISGAGGTDFDTIVGLDYAEMVVISGPTTITSGAGGVDIDTIIGCEQIISAAAGVDIDTIKGCDLATIASIAGGTDFADSMSIGSGDEISKISVSADSIQFIIGDSTYSFAIDNTYATP